MANNIEWHSAKERPYGHTAKELAEVSHDGDNEEAYIGIGSGDTMLYGTVHEIVTWLEAAAREVERVHAIEIVRKRQAAEANIRNGLSRDDETDFGSIFEDKVQVIRNLNVDSLPDAHDGKPDPLNYEYCRGQVELLMDTTDWLADLRPEKEEVFLYIFGQEMT